MRGICNTAPQAGSEVLRKHDKKSGGPAAVQPPLQEDNTPFDAVVQDMRSVGSHVV